MDSRAGSLLPLVAGPIDQILGLNSDKRSRPQAAGC